tara:strand:+ start:660 stop:938 length:279 start_codon:yes stop_codon:yes gene_type:complete
MGFEGGESQIKSKEVEEGICTDCVKEEKNEEKGSRGYHNEDSVRVRVEISRNQKHFLTIEFWRTLKGHTDYDETSNGWVSPYTSSPQFFCNW